MPHSPTEVVHYPAERTPLQSFKCGEAVFAALILCEKISAELNKPSEEWVMNIDLRTQPLLQLHLMCPDETL